MLRTMLIRQNNGGKGVVLYDYYVNSSSTTFYNKLSPERAEKQQDRIENNV